MIASLGMYDRAECQPANDRYWALIRDGLRATGLPAPDGLTRGESAYWSAWSAPDLVLSQTCGLPYRAKLHGKVTLIGTPDFGIEGCPPGHYRSVLIARADDRRDGLLAFDGARFAYNEQLSQSGWAAPQAHAAALGLHLPASLCSGGHCASAQAVAEGRADFAALDAVTWRLIKAHDPALATLLRVVDQTAPTPGLPYISALGSDATALFRAIRAAIDALSAMDRNTLGLCGLVAIPAAQYLALPLPPTIPPSHPRPQFPEAHINGAIARIAYLDCAIRTRRRANPSQRALQRDKLSALLRRQTGTSRSATDKRDTVTTRKAPPPPTADTPVIAISDLHKSYGNLEVLKGVDLVAPRGHVISLIGSSGSGKSTLLRCCNLLEDSQQGDILFEGEAVHWKGTGLARHPADRAQVIRIRTNLSMVFQQFNLWSHLTILQNVMEAPVTVLGRNRAEVEASARKYLEKVGIAEKADAYPAMLSGGQQQRAAIARALCMEPRALLFDEPTSALDPELEQEVVKVIKALAEEGRTMILVTHDMRLAADVSDHVIFLHLGKIEEEGPPETLFGNPQTERLRGFLSATST